MAFVCNQYSKIEFEIRDETPESLCICKPEGFFVHQPENQGFKVPREKLILQNLRSQINAKVYPIHRLDSATRGLLLFAKSPEQASVLTHNFLQTAQKKYLAVCRGWLPESGHITIPLESDSSDSFLECSTQFETLKKIELPFRVGKRFQTSRLSLVRVSPQTGRYHQIRRHMNRISHPIIGDGEHGDSHYNRFFREQFGFSGLNLWAYELKYFCPFRNKQIVIQDTKNTRWTHITEILFVNPTESKLT